jgi:hypothetical protein
MVSRNRSTCGVRPYIRATCNPDADSWVADFLAWWIDPETGLRIPERAGMLRYYIRVADKIIWADTSPPASTKPQSAGAHLLASSVAGRSNHRRRLVAADHHYRDVDLSRSASSVCASLCEPAF